MTKWLNTVWILSVMAVVLLAGSLSLSYGLPGASDHSGRQLDSRNVVPTEMPFPHP